MVAVVTLSGGCRDGASNGAVEQGTPWELRLSPRRGPITPSSPDRRTAGQGSGHRRSDPRPHEEDLMRFEPRSVGLGKQPVALSVDSRPAVGGILGRERTPVAADAVVVVLRCSACRLTDRRGNDWDGWQFDLVGKEVVVELRICGPIPGSMILCSDPEKSCPPDMVTDYMTSFVEQDARQLGDAPCVKPFGVDEEPKLRVDSEGPQTRRRCWCERVDGRRHERLPLHRMEPRSGEPLIVKRAAAKRTRHVSRSKRPLARSSGAIATSASAGGAAPFGRFWMSVRANATPKSP